MLDEGYMIEAHVSDLDADYDAIVAILGKPIEYATAFEFYDFGYHVMVYDFPTKEEAVAAANKVKHISGGVVVYEKEPGVVVEVIEKDEGHHETS